MTHSNPMNRRNWLRNSFMALLGTSIIPAQAKDQLLTKAVDLEGLLSSNRKEDESYWELVKQQFPFEKGLYYFNNASLGPSPSLVLQATNNFRSTLESFPSKYMWTAWKEEKEKVRAKAADLLKVSAEEIALIHNTTEGMNLVASSLDLQAGDEVIISDHEHPSGTIPWKYWQERKGIKLVRPILPLRPQSKEELVTSYRNAITPKTKVISIVHITNTNGMIMPIKEISEMAHKRNILVAVDGAQSIGALDFNLSDLSCDFYAGSSHKWLFSPKGMGIFYAKQASQHYLKPLIVASGYEDTSIRRLENYNTRNLPEVLGLGVALDFQNLIGSQKKQQRLYALKNYFLKQINANKKFSLSSPIANNLSAGILTVEVQNWESRELRKKLLEKHKIDCRPMFTHGLNGLRISLSIFNTKADIDHLIKMMDVA